MLKIDYQQLSSETLQNLLQECVTRNGTDYGAEEVSTAAKCQQLLAKLHAREAVVVFEEEEGYCDIISAKQFAAFQMAEFDEA